VKAGKRAVTPPTERSLSSGRVLRVSGEATRRVSKGVSETTPSVGISVKFDEEFLPSSEPVKSSIGTFQQRAPVKLVFGEGRSAPKESAPQSLATRDSMPPEESSFEELLESDAALPPVAAPPPIPARIDVDRPKSAAARPRKRAEPSLDGVRESAKPEQMSKRRKGVVAVGLPLAALIALGVFVPTAINNDPGETLIGIKEASVTEPRDLPVRPAAAEEVFETAALSIENAPKTEPKPAPQASLENGPEIDVKPDQMPEPAVGTAEISREGEADQSREIRQAAVPIVKKPPPRPQRLAAPSVKTETPFVPSRPVETPPDPNSMAFVPDNPFSKTQPDLLGEADTAFPAAIKEIALVAAPLMRPQKPGLTDAPAVASAQAERPVPPAGPDLLAHIRESLSPPFSALPPERPANFGAPNRSIAPLPFARG